MIQFKIALLVLTFGSLMSCIPNKNKPAPIPYSPAGVDDFKFENPEGGEEQEEESRWVRQQMEELTDNFTNFPTSDGVNDVINGALSGPVPNCLADGVPLAQPEGSEGNLLHPAAVGARRLLASYFQSCSSLDKALVRTTPPLEGVSSASSIGGQKGVAGGKVRNITNLNSYVNSHLVLKDLKNDPNYPGPKCEDATKRPPVYGYGSTAKISGGEMKIFQGGAGVYRGSQPASGIDCSAFISVALAAQGLKTTKTAQPYERLTTRGFSQRMTARNSCLGHAPVSPEDSVRPGDMINHAGSHIIMVDTVGEDPLGVKKHSESNSCMSISTRDFDFTYIHSGAVKNSYGPSRVQANLHDGGTMWNNMLLLARKLCLQKVRKDENHRASSQFGMSTSMSIIRHKTHEPECVGETRMKIEGEDCIDGCSNLDKDVKNEA